MTRLGPIEIRVAERLKQLQADRVLERLRQKDPSLWSRGNPETIRNRLGWISSAEFMEKEVGRMDEFAKKAAADGFTHALLLGMGGSSLCPLIWSRTFKPKAGYLSLDVLDSTDPEEIAAAEKRMKGKKTLFLLASKSGNTIEVDSMDRFFSSTFRDRSYFAAITDAGSPLARQAQEESFRDCFLNPSDIGGRFSALSFFGLVPAALMGMDVQGLLRSVMEFARSEDPGVSLGAILAEALLSGRDKLTLFFSPEIAAFGGWVEQLVAESTGKEKQGIIPLDQEPLVEVPRGNDRLFVVTRTRSSAQSATAFSLADMGHPYVEFVLNQPLDLGREFLRWEVATAVAGSILGINPFDEPNVSESKEKTKELLSIYEKDMRLPAETVRCKTKEVSVYTDERLSPAKSLEAILSSHLSRREPGDYVALLAYLPYDKHDDALRVVGTTLSSKSGLPVTVGYGPRYLHSTGQLHKGGANRGIYILVTRLPVQDQPIPGKPFSFGTLEKAQAQGDFRALVHHGRRVAWLEFADAVTGLEELAHALRS